MAAEDQRETGDDVRHARPARSARREARSGRQPVGDQAAEQIAGHADDQRKSGEDAQRCGVEPVPLLQVGRQPGDAEVEDHAVRDVHDAQREHVPACEAARPVRPARRVAAVGGPLGDDRLAVPRRSRPDAPTDRCGTTCARPRPRRIRRRRSSTKIARHDMKGSSHSTSAGVRPPTRCAPAKKMPCTRAALAIGNPARERARHARPRAGFAHAEQEPHGEHRRIAERRSRRRRQARPPQDDAREHGSRALAIRPPRGRNLEQARTRAGRP